MYWINQILGKRVFNKEGCKLDGLKVVPVQKIKYDTALCHQRKTLASTNKCPLTNWSEWGLAIVSILSKHYVCVKAKELKVG